MQKDLINGASTAPGRVRTFLNEPKRKTMPHSCVLRVYDNYLAGLLNIVSKDLCGGAGVKVNLDQFKNFKPYKVEWGFYLDPNHPDYKLMSEKQRKYYVEPTEDDLIISPEDSMSGDNGIRQSWTDFTREIGFSALVDRSVRIVVDLSKLRPAGTLNSKGLEASGALGQGRKGETSFLSIYEAIANHLEDGRIGTLLVLLGTLNETLRRGGFKRGIVCTSLDYRSEAIYDYLAFPNWKVPGGHKKSIRLDKGLLDCSEELLAKIADSAEQESTFLEKIKPDRPDIYANVCITGDTWVDTNEGAKQVNELVGKQFIANVNGEMHFSTEQGFWSNGVKPVLYLETDDGYSIRLTDNHQLQKATRKGYGDPYKLEWIEAGSLKPGDKIQLVNQFPLTQWNGKGNQEEGWLLGHLVGDGTLVKNQGILEFWGDSRDKLFNQALTFIESNLPKLVAAHNNREYGLGSGGKERTRTTLGRNSTSKSLHTKRLYLLAQEYGIVPGYKVATKEVEQASSDFYVGFIRGLFDTDAHVSLGQPNGSGRSIQISQVERSTLERVQRMLLRLGIKSNIWERREPHMNKFPDGEYMCRQAYRLDITGDNIGRYAELIGFDDDQKAKALETLLASYKRKPYSEKYLATVKAITPDGFEEVYDCTINDVHCFSANGIVAHNCQGLAIPANNICLIWRVNLGLIQKPEDLLDAFEEATVDIINLHLLWRDNFRPEDLSHLPELKEDKQVALDIMGMASLLANLGISYQEFTDALRWFNGDSLVDVNPEASKLVEYFAKAYLRSSYIADSICDSEGLDPLERIHTPAEPSQRHFTDCKDSQGYTTTRSIFPPFERKQRRVSDHEQQKVYIHNPAIEIASEVGAELNFEFACEWKKFVDSVGRSHGYMSFDSFEPITPNWLRKFIDSPLESKYYSESTRFDQTYLKKDSAVCELGEMPRTDECLVCAE